MKTTNETPRKRVGFKWYDEPTAESNNLPAEISVKTESNSIIHMTPAQIELCETIKNLAEIIISKEFCSFADNQRELFVAQLMNNIALNAELTAKTILISQNFIETEM